MILRETLPKRSGFLNQVDVITGLGASERGFQTAAVTDTKRSAESLNEAGVNRENILKPGVGRHCASRWRSSGC